MKLAFNDYNTLVMARVKEPLIYSNMANMYALEAKSVLEMALAIVSGGDVPREVAPTPRRAKERRNDGTCAVCSSVL